MATVLSYHPSGVTFPPQVYCDANFLVSFYEPNHQWHKKASTLLIELTSQKVEIQVSVLAIDEALCQILILTYEYKNGTGSWKRNKPLKNDPNVCKQFYPELNTFVRNLWRLPNLRLIEGPTPAFDIVEDSLKNIMSYSLAPRDAFHLAILKAIGLKMILTNDSDFDRVHDLPIHVLHFW
jgi:predicted nucleic acid-binding protein